MATTPPAAGGGLEAKHYILAAFTAGFIAAAVVTVVFVVLSPARIYFSVTSASSHDLGPGCVQLNLTISANSTSRRAAVLYKMFFVDVTGPQLVDWVRADVSSADQLSLQQLPGDVREIHASVAALQVGKLSTGDNTSHSFSVRVTAVARFEVGIAWTRLYDIKVMCAPVDFFAKNSTVIDVACA